MTTLAHVKRKQASRTRRAKTADAATTAKRTFATLDRDGLGRWMKRPGKYDVSGVDTKGKGKVVITRSLRSHPKRRKKSTR